MVPFSSFTVRNSVVFLQRPFSSWLCSYSDVYYVWILKGQHFPPTWCSSSLFKDSIWIWKCLQLNLMMHLNMYKGGKFAGEKLHSMRIWTSLWFADCMPMLETLFKREIWVNVHLWNFVTIQIHFLWNRRYTLENEHGTWKSPNWNQLKIEYILL